jgi:hypothetical protein
VSSSSLGLPGSPPLLLERPVCAARTVKLVELCHVLVREREVEDLPVLGDTLAMGRLRDDRDLALDRPAKEYLGRRASMAFGDP